MPDLAIREESPGRAIQNLKTRIYVASAIIRGLEGGVKFSWGSGEASSYVAIAHALGYRLVTRTAATKMGHALKRGAPSVGWIYFKAPLSRHAEVYVLGVQTKPAPKREAQNG